jgi:hypothetical protein
MKGVNAGQLDAMAELAAQAPWDARTRIDVVALLALLGGRRFGKDVVSFLTERLGMLKEILQDSPLYELARKEGEARGEARGLAALHKACLSLIEAKAPKLAAGAKPRLASITELAQLEKLLVELGMAQDAEAVQAALTHVQ